MFAWMENLVPCSGTMLAALDDMGWLIFVIIAILSSLFGGKKKKEEQPWEEDEQQQPQTGKTGPSNLEEELRRMLTGGSAQEPPPPVVVSAPPVLEPAWDPPKPEPKPVVVKTASPLHEAQAAYEKASHLKEAVAKRMEQSHRHHATPVATTEISSAELREVIAMVRQPKTARQAIVASVILSSPKGLEI
jgi:hypothetical protein